MKLEKRHTNKRLINIWASVQKIADRQCGKHPGFYQSLSPLACLRDTGEKGHLRFVNIKGIEIV